MAEIRDSNPEETLQVGDRVVLEAMPPYFKTADTMPMLRPPNLVPVGTLGQVTGLRPGGYWEVRFDKGTFLLDGKYLAPFSGELDATTEPQPDESDDDTSQAELEST